MICEHCQCQAPKEGHGLPEECLEALLAWRKEADARLIAYEEASVTREAESACVKGLLAEVQLLIERSSSWLHDSTEWESDELLAPLWQDFWNRAFKVKP